MFTSIIFSFESMRVGHTVACLRSKSEMRLESNTEINASAVSRCDAEKRSRRQEKLQGGKLIIFLH